MARPTMSPSAAGITVQVNGKRKRDCVDLTEDQVDDVALPSTTLATTNLPTTLTTMSESPTVPPTADNDGESLIEDYADHFEMAPYQNGK